MNLVCFQAAELPYSQARIKKQPDHELLSERLTGLDKPVALLAIQGLTSKHTSRASYLSRVLIKAMVSSLSAEALLCGKKDSEVGVSQMEAEGDKAVAALCHPSLARMAGGASKEVHNLGTDPVEE